MRGRAHGAAPPTGRPIVWVKLTLLAIAGAASFFPTTVIIQRAIEQRKLGDTPIAPMSEKLAARMTSRAAPVGKGAPPSAVGKQWESRGRALLTDTDTALLPPCWPGILNAELLALLSIPLAATLMSRGVGYAEWLPWQARPCVPASMGMDGCLGGWAGGRMDGWMDAWMRGCVCGWGTAFRRAQSGPLWQAGAAPVVLALVGLGSKYVKEALQWTEDAVLAVDAVDAT